MGLLALLVAFTFSIALERFDTRRVNVLHEANAIGTTYLRTQLLEEPHRGRISKLLVDYTEARIALATAHRGPQQCELLRTSDGLVVDLWTATVAAFPSMRPYSFSHSFLDSMNNLIDMDAARKAGRGAHVPAAVFFALFLYLFAAAGVISYVVVGIRSRQTASVLFVLVWPFVAPDHRYRSADLRRHYGIAGADAAAAGLPQSPAARVVRSIQCAVGAR